jgi:uncharacterized protein (TIGR00255 family)
MTGFARQEIPFTNGVIACEIRSINHRYLEPSFKLSDSLKAIEPQLREQLRNQLSRGKIDIYLAFKPDDKNGSGLDFNKELAQDLIKTLHQIQQLNNDNAPLSALDILRWPGVLKSPELNPTELEVTALALFNQALTGLLENRSREGQELANIIEQRLNAVAAQVADARKRLPELAAAQHDKLRARLESLNIDINEDRFAQELVYLAQKSDVAEELDRLDTHIQEVRRTLKQKEPVGRRLDFLMQELNREANTFSSKSTTSQNTQVAVDMKVWIEQMREQVQNIE